MKKSARKSSPPATTRRASRVSISNAPLALRAIARMAIGPGGGYAPEMYDDSISHAYALARRSLSGGGLAARQNIPDMAEKLYVRDLAWNDINRRMRRFVKDSGISDRPELEQLTFELMMVAREAGFLLGLSTAYEVMRSTGGAR